MIKPFTAHFISYGLAYTALAIFILSVLHFFMIRFSKLEKGLWSFALLFRKVGKFFFKLYYHTNQHLKTMKQNRTVGAFILFFALIFGLNVFQFFLLQRAAGVMEPVAAFIKKDKALTAECFAGYFPFAVLQYFGDEVKHEDIPFLRGAAPNAMFCDIDETKQFAFFPSAFLFADFDSEDGIGIGDDQAQMGTDYGIGIAEVRLDLRMGRQDTDTGKNTIGDLVGDATDEWELCPVFVILHEETHEVDEAPVASGGSGGG
ncbi:unnamed protein product [Sphagnum jensenii]|uniref:Uncharacterized protein n=1 Tax=Sphagnum jensenii TaxID=128206 RepID=A0ABP0V8H9_9BRYO